MGEEESSIGWNDMDLNKEITFVMVASAKHHFKDSHMWKIATVLQDEIMNCNEKYLAGK